MNLVRITYSGAKPYRDKTSLRNDWQPGDTKTVTTEAAKILLRFVEFKKAEGKPETADAEQEQANALATIQESQKREQDESDALAGMLLSVDQMDKGALEAYARKYDVDLDKRGKLDSLRGQVVNLIHQYGVR
jgi:hypothetical protein